MPSLGGTPQRILDVVDEQCTQLFIIFTDIQLFTERKQACSAPCGQFNLRGRACLNSPALGEHVIFTKGSGEAARAQQTNLKRDGNQAKDVFWLGPDLIDEFGPWRFGVLVHGFSFAVT